MFLYYIFVSPLLYLFEALIEILYPILVLNPTVAIFTISFIVTFLSYPIFEKIEEMCIKDNTIYQKLLPKISSIKRNFKGTEQRMLLHTLFRQNHYHPLLAHFKQSLTIFLQVPIFLASYITISNNYLFQIPILETVNESLNFSYLPIRILPILMTLINIISVFIYMKDKPLTAKIYAYILPAIFLILLYFSPASIVMYWIFNNTFALLRNIWFYRKKLFPIWSITFGIAFILFAFELDFSLNTLQALLLSMILLIVYKLLIRLNQNNFHICLLLLFTAIAMILYNLGFFLPTKHIIILMITFFAELTILIYRLFLKNVTFDTPIKDYCLYWALITITIGFYLPIKRINSDFVEFSTYIDIADLISTSFYTSLGTFFIYPLMLFYILKPYHKVLFFLTLCFTVGSFIFLYTFVAQSSVVNAWMQFSKPYTAAPCDRIFSDLISICTSIIFITFVLRKKFTKLLNILILGSILTYSYAYISTKKELMENISHIQSKTNGERVLTLSSQQKNVLILFLDRAVSGFFPLILKEKPELLPAYDGFVYYPYTVSFAQQTLYSAPSLLGGYHYTPLRLQNDASKNIVDKHNEAITLMPETFRKNKYLVTLSEMPDVNYGDTKKQSPFHPDIKFINKSTQTRKECIAQRIKNNMFWFNLFSISPFFLEGTIYNNGRYLYSNSNEDCTDISAITALNELNKFESFIQKLSIDEKAPNTFTLFISLLTHSPTVLDDNYQFFNDYTLYIKLNYLSDNIKHYNVNMLAHLEIEKLLTKLKENNAYNNTRIIIMSDHGWPIDNLKGIEPNIATNNSLLLLKDFGSGGRLKTDNTFMTTADVPYLATKDLIPDKQNPFLQEQALNYKKEGVDIIAKPLDKWGPQFYDTQDRTYLYDEDIEYLHIDENNIKEMIKIDEEFLY